MAILSQNHYFHNTSVFLIIEDVTKPINDHKDHSEQNHSYGELGYPIMIG